MNSTPENILGLGTKEKNVKKSFGPWKTLLAHRKRANQTYRPSGDISYGRERVVSKRSELLGFQPKGRPTKRIKGAEKKKEDIER